MALRGGIDLGGTKIQAVVLDDHHELHGQARRPTPLAGGPADIADAMAHALREAATLARTQTAELHGIGVGSPGQVDTAAGTVTSAKNLPGWAGTFPLAATLEEALGAPVRVTNDVGAATDAEALLGAGRDLASFLAVFWGTGVGGAFVQDGHRWRGRGFAGELGHMVVKVDGARCPCGRRGCMEAYAGRKAMEERARRLVEDGRRTELFKLMNERGRDRLTSGIWERALARGDRMAAELVDRALAAIGAAVASAVNLLDPDGVVLGGGLGVRFGAPMADRLADAMHPHLFADKRPPVVRVAALGDLGGAIGASLLVAEPAATGAGA
ncbi:MAG TPA: ROK family protein [Solirubrobacteraceae bacterium]|nr:ROK family protein [Solirubrobacteraceae bacterium]